MKKLSCLKIQRTNEIDCKNHTIILLIIFPRKHDQIHTATHNTRYQQKWMCNNLKLQYFLKQINHLKSHKNIYFMIFWWLAACVGPKIEIMVIKKSVNYLIDGLKVLAYHVPIYIFALTNFFFKQGSNP